MPPGRNTKQYAKASGIKPRTARDRAQKGKAKAAKPGGRDWQITGPAKKKQKPGPKKGKKK